jgi:DNA-directed RNA polymerase specialized sigma24 family protein
MNRDGSATEAEEAFHAALCSLLNQLEKGAVIHDYGAYLFRSSWNAFLNERKQGNRVEEISPPSSLFRDSNANDDLNVSIVPSGTTEAREPGPGPDYLTHRQILMEAAEEIITELTIAQQNILNLSFDPELSLTDDQIAQRLKLTTDYVRLARFRAMKTLREKMHLRGFRSL